MWAGGMLRAVFRFSAFVIMTLLYMLFYRFSRSPEWQRRIAAQWFRCTGHIIGLKLQATGQAFPREVRGGPSPSVLPSVLYVANHVSSLDIFVLGLKLDAVFVAKSDVADWPLLGRLACMRQCVIVTRQAAQVAKEARLIRAHLQAGRNVILLPEGTTGDGGRLLPFKSSLLAAVDGLPHSLVQPGTIAYPDLVRGEADASLAWYGDMSMMSHLWSVLGRASAPTRAYFHAPLAASDFPCRKTLAETCPHIDGGVSRLLTPEKNREAEDRNDYRVGAPIPA